MNNKKVSIITICLNAEKNLKMTLDSILNLNSQNFEYIIKDGKSKDKTNQIIELYKKKFEKKGIDFTHIIMQDSGIYSAMNQAILYCKGEWINFMNAGDTFYDINVLKDIFERNINNDVGVIYGHTLFKISRKLAFISNHNVKEIENGMPFCHQSTFVRREIMTHYKFDKNFKIISDYNLFLNLYFDNIQFLNVNMVISSYDCTGISSFKFSDINREKNILKLKYNLNYKFKRNIIINKFKGIIIKKSPFLGNICFNYKQMKKILKNLNINI